MTDRTVQAGADLRWTGAVTDDYGTPRDITGATGTVTAYLSPTSRTSPPATGTVAITDGPAGVWQAEIPDTATDSVVGTYSRVWYFEVKITESGGRETVVESGRMLCLP